MRLRRRALLLFVLLFSLNVLAQTSGPRFEISFPATAHAGPITGRVFVILSRHDGPEPRLQAGDWFQQTPIYGADVSRLPPGQAAVIDGSTLGFPLQSLKELPAGEYNVQALINVYTEFHRADGHTVWAHMDQWEGQQFNRSPGNMYSEVQKVRLDPAAGYDVKLEASQVISPIEVPPNTKYVKRVKFASKLVSQFWGRPMYIGATVLLPKGYDEHPDQRYPVVYVQDHFTLRAPFGFQDGSGEEGGWPSGKEAREITGAWLSEKFPRLILVTFLHPTPFFDDSYAVNSSNQGPYGDAIMQELIPYLETHFRIIGQPWARVLTGGSTGTTTALNAGTITLTGPGVSTTLQSPIAGTYVAQIASIPQNGGAFTFTGAGASGTDTVGPFTATVNFPNPLINWTNQSDSASVTRSAGQTYNWTGGAAGTYVTMQGSSSANGVSGSYVCIAPVEAKAFTVPSYILLGLPAGTGDSMLTNSTNYTTFTASGLDFGFAIGSVSFSVDSSFK